MKISYVCKVLIVFSVFACESSINNNSHVKDEIHLKGFHPKTKVKYKLPSPVELYRLMNGYGATFKGELMNSIDLADNYITSSEKSINFGIYASDLAYASVFEMHDKSHAYFKMLKGMANQLGITEGYDKDIVDRLDNNFQNSDSLLQITNDSYWEVCNFLESSEKSDVLSKILLGGWVESVYIAVGSVDTFDENNKIVQLVSEQSFLLENLINYLETLKGDKDSDSYLKRLYDLQKSFDKLFYNPEGTAITKQQYKEIASKIKYFRKELIK